MLKTLPVILFVILQAITAHAQLRCSEVLTETSSQQSQLMSVTWELYETFSSIKVFGNAFTRPGQLRTMRKELEGVQERVEEVMAISPKAKESLELWLDFNKYWLEKVNEFQKLDRATQNRFRPVLEIPLSIATKHLIKFLEQDNFRTWNTARLNLLLTIHKKYPEADLEAALTLIEREALRSFSRFDFVRCRY